MNWRNFAKITCCFVVSAFPTNSTWLTPSETFYADQPWFLFCWKFPPTTIVRCNLKTMFWRLFFRIQSILCSACGRENFITMEKSFLFCEDLRKISTFPYTWFDFHSSVWHMLWFGDNAPQVLCSWKSQKHHTVAFRFVLLSRLKYSIFIAGEIWKTTLSTIFSAK